MPTVLLIRHGQASFGGADYDVLSELGARQAAAARAEVVRRGVAPVRFVAGDLARQRETALSFLDGGADLEIDPRWNEYDAADILGAHSPAHASLERPVGPGGEALTSREFQNLLDEALQMWIAAGAGGSARETWVAFQGRCSAALDDLLASLRSGETAVVITSGGVLGALAAGLLGLPDSAMVGFNHVVINGGITKIVSGRRGASLISFNEHGHLEADGLISYR